MDTVIGRKCEIEECVCVAEENDPRCYDHSVMRLIEPLFEHFDEQCSFGGINCTGTATHMNEHEVSMCENCYNEWTRYRRIQRGRRYEGRTIGQLVGPHNELIMEALWTPVVTLVEEGDETE